MKKKTLPKRFLSIKDKATSNAVNMYFIYLSFVPKGWDDTKVYLPAVAEVRKHFNVDYGFENMIRWGVQHGCCKSKTSSGRHKSMSDAYTSARMLLGMGVVLSNVTIK